MCVFVKAREMMPWGGKQYLSLIYSPAGSAGLARVRNRLQQQTYVMVFRRHSSRTFTHCTSLSLVSCSVLRAALSSSAGSRRPFPLAAQSNSQSAVVDSVCALCDTSPDRACVSFGRFRCPAASPLLVTALVAALVTAHVCRRRCVTTVVKRPGMRPGIAAMMQAELNFHVRIMSDFDYLS